METVAPSAAVASSANSLMDDIQSCRVLSIGPNTGSVGQPLRIANKDSITDAEADQVIRIVETIMKTPQESKIFLGTGVHDLYSKLVLKRKESKVSSKPKPTFKLVYFQGRGRAEISRLIMAQGDISYTDYRFSEEEWEKTVKKSLPYNQAPVLVLNDGFILSDSNAMENYLASNCGLNGRDPFEQAKISMIVEGVKDATGKFQSALYDEDEKSKKQKLDEYFQKQLPQWLVNLERILGEWGPQYFVGNRLTLADLHAFNSFSNIMAVNAESLKSAPLLVALVERVGKLPKIAAWIESRPKTPY